MDLHMIKNMEISIAIPVDDFQTSPEQYELEITQEELRIAEEKLERMMDLVKYFFVNPIEQDKIYQQIKQNPTKNYDKPFMNKIAKAMIDVNRCKQAVQWASEALDDTRLTPAKVKTQVKRLIIQQAVHMENKMDTQMKVMKIEQERMNIKIQQLQTQLRDEIRKLRR